MKKNNPKANIKSLLSFMLAAVFIICLCVSTMPAKTASATADFVGYSGENNISNAAMFSDSNTHNYYTAEQFFSGGFRKLYNMDVKNNNLVDSRKPLITVFTHGYGGRASHWSNNGSNTNNYAQFAYDSASAIERVAEKAGGANKYWAVCNGNSFKLIDLNVQPANQPYIKEGSTISRITSTELLKHIIIVFDSSEAIKEAAHDVVYDEFNYMLSKIVYDVKTVTGFLPKINLIGHSRGGITNLQYALDHPDLVASLISTGTPYLGGKMLGNDEVLKMFNFIQNDIIPEGMKDIRNTDLQNHFMKRWNDNRGKGLNLYNNINAHAIGGYSNFYFLNNVIDASGAFLDKYNPELLKLAISNWGLINFPIAGNWILGSYGVDEAQKAILNTIKTSVRTEYIINYPNVMTIYYMDDDLVVDLNSQLATGYSGFTQKSKIFADTNAFNKRSDWGMPPIVHNLEARDPDFTNYILTNITLEKHNLTLVATDSTHTYECSDCDYQLSENHINRYTYKDFNSHSRFCTVCTRWGEEAHNFVPVRTKAAAPSSYQCKNCGFIKMGDIGIVPMTKEPEPDHLSS